MMNVDRKSKHVHSASSCASSLRAELQQIVHGRHYTRPVTTTRTTAAAAGADDEESRQQQQQQQQVVPPLALPPVSSATAATSGINRPNNSMGVSFLTDQTNEEVTPRLKAALKDRTKKGENDRKSSLATMDAAIQRGLSLPSTELEQLRESLARFTRQYHEVVSAPIGGSAGGTGGSGAAGTNTGSSGGAAAPATARQPKKPVDLLTPQTPLFAHRCLSERLSTSVHGRGMHRFVREKLTQRREGEIESFSRNPHRYFSSPSYWEQLREQGNIGSSSAAQTARRKSPQKFEFSEPLETKVDVLNKNRTLEEVRARKAMQDREYLDSLSQRVEHKYKMTLSTGANAAHCAKVFATWIRLVQASRVFADVIAEAWDPFDETRRERALFHPPRGAKRVSELTMAAVLLTKNMFRFRLRKRIQQKKGALKIIFVWLTIVCREMKLKFAARKHQRNAKKIQTAFRSFRACRNAVKLIWAQQWRVEERKAIRLVELSKDENVQQYIQEERDREKMKHSSNMPMFVGNSLQVMTKQQRRQSALVKQRVKELKALESDFVLYNDYFEPLMKCAAVKPTPGEKVMQQINAIFQEREKIFFEEYRKYVHATTEWKERQIWLTSRGDDLLDTFVEEPAPTLKYGIPRVLHRVELLDKIIALQKENVAPIEQLSFRIENEEGGGGGAGMPASGYQSMRQLSMRGQNSPSFRLHKRVSYAQGQQQSQSGGQGQAAAASGGGSFRGRSFGSTPSKEGGPNTSTTITPSKEKGGDPISSAKEEEGSSPQE